MITVVYIHCDHSGTHARVITVEHMHLCDRSGTHGLVITVEHMHL